MTVFITRVGDFAQPQKEYLSAEKFTSPSLYGISGDRCQTLSANQAVQDTQNRLHSARLRSLNIALKP